MIETCCLYIFYFFEAVVSSVMFTKIIIVVIFIFSQFIPIYVPRSLENIPTKIFKPLTSL